MRLRTRTEVRSVERPRAYGDTTSPRAGPGRSRSGVGVAAVLAGSVLTLAAIAVVLIHLLAHGHGATIATIAVGGVALAAALALLWALWRLRRDHARLARREAEAQRLAELDDLTGLGNYRMFTRQLAAEVARARRHDESFTLVLLDLDGFKAINDRYGHQAGDELLVTVARRIGETARRHGALAGRLGGDEFVVLVEVSPGIGGLIALAMSILGAVSYPVALRVGRVRVSACAGIAECAAGSPASAALIADADAALYQAKSSGPGRWAVGGGTARGARRWQAS